MLTLLLYGIIDFLVGETVMIRESDVLVSRHEYLKTLVLSLLPVFTFYYFSKMSYITETSMKKWTVVFIVVATLCFYRYYQDAQIRMMQKGIENGGAANNGSYLFLSIIPLTLLYRNKPLIQYFFLVVCTLFIVLGMKRGAILIGFLALFVITAHSIKRSQLKQKPLLVLIILLVVIALFMFIDNLIESNDFFLYRLESTLEGNTSGRGELYSFFYHHLINDSKLLHLIFGNGANATLRIGSNYAHNDWLEIAINQGLFGVFIYILYWLSFITMIIKTANSDIKSALTIIAIIMFSMSIVSMSITSINLYLASSLGYYIYKSQY